MRNVRNVFIIQCLYILIVLIPAVFLVRSYMEANALGFYGYLTACTYALALIYNHSSKLNRLL